MRIAKGSFSWKGQTDCWHQGICVMMVSQSEQRITRETGGDLFSFQRFSSKEEKQVVMAMKVEKLWGGRFKEMPSQDDCGFSFRERC